MALWSHTQQWTPRLPLYTHSKCLNPKSSASKQYNTRVTQFFLQATTSWTWHALYLTTTSPHSTQMSMTYSWLHFTSNASGPHFGGLHCGKFMVGRVSQFTVYPMANTNHKFLSKGEVGGRGHGCSIWSEINCTLTPRPESNYLALIRACLTVPVNYS